MPDEVRSPTRYLVGFVVVAILGLTASCGNARASSPTRPVKIAASSDAASHEAASDPSYVTNAWWSTGPLGTTLHVIPTVYGGDHGIIGASAMMAQAIKIAGSQPYSSAVYASLFEQLQCHLVVILKIPYNLDTWRPNVPFATEVAHRCNPGVNSLPATAPPATSSPAASPPTTAPPGTSPPATSPPATAAPATSSPATSSPATAPPATSPPATAPPATAPPATSPPTVWTEQEGHHGADTFSNPYNASGQGPSVGAGAYVEISCKLYAPQISSANPDGYWYLVASSPWNNAYYAVANTFMNGDSWGCWTTNTCTHNTDFNVRNC